MKTKIILTVTIIVLYCSYTFSYSQGCHGMSSSSGGKENSSTTAKSKTTEGTSSSTATTYYICPMHPEVINNKAGKCSKCGMDLVQKTSSIEKTEQTKDTIIYTCPMHPEVQSDKPGNCPKCGMALVKKSEASGMKMKCGMMGGMSDMSKTENKEKNNSAEKNITAIEKDSIIYTCSMHPDVKLDKPGKCPKCGMALVKAESTKAIYECPMKCEGKKTYSKPGSCPKCGMDLKEIKK